MTEPIEQAGRTGAQECRGTEVVCGPLQAGAQVTVYHVAMIQRPLIEGTAIVLGVFDEARDLYWVRFAGEPERQALVEAWLAGNPARAAEVSADRALRERLRARLAPIAEEAIPARLRVANIRSRYRPLAGRWFPVAAAAVLCLAVGGAAGWFGQQLAVDGGFEATDIGLKTLRQDRWD